jgi:hypothetical protein
MAKKKRKIDKQFKHVVASHAIRVMMLAVIVFSAVGIHLQPHPTASHTSVPPHKAVATSYHAATTPKTTPTVTPAPALTAKSTPVPTTTVVPPSGAPSEPVVAPSPSSNVSGLAPVAPTTAPSGGGSGSTSTPTTTPTTTSYTSTNWSGYLATVGNFTAISAAWTAPPATGVGSTTSADSTWVGIGGVSTNDLIQVGTQNLISPNGNVTTEAFYELLPNVSQLVPDVTVSAGDSITASLVETSASQWTISLTDKTDNQSYTGSVSYASSLSSAEWIEEDPSYSTGRQVPFDNFGTVSFTGGAATSNGTSASLAGNNAQPIIMVNRSGQTVSTPSSLTGDGAGFTVTRKNAD